MAAHAARIPGISIDVDELIEVRTRLSGMSAAKVRRRPGSYPGTREMLQRGRGMEYAESRAYVYGDDVRTMDWRVMARTGEAYTKLFAEEKGRSRLLAIDLSASMFYGTRHAFKSWAAAQLAAHAGWLASFRGERIGGLVVAPGYHSEIRPGKTRSGLLAMFHQLARASREQAADADANRFNFLLGELRRVVGPGASIVLVSDFLGADAQSPRLLADISRRNPVTAYWIYDRSEVEAWPNGRYPVLQGQRNVFVDLADSAQAAWLQRQQLRHRQRVETLCANFAIDLLPVCCNRDITAQFLQQPAS